MYSIRIVAALRTVSSSIRRPKQRIVSRRLKTDMAEKNSTASVVVFMPPAVEPGEPPVSISRMMMKRPTSLSFVKSRVLKPAVLGVTD